MPKILHLLDDKNLGGVRSTVDSINHSRLNKQFEFAIASYEEINSILQDSPPDIILIHNPSAWKYLSALYQLKRSGIKLILCEHHYSEGFERLNVPSVWRFRLMLKVFYQLVDRVVAVSYGQADWLRQHHLVAPRKLIVIQQGRILDSFLSIPAQPIQAPLTLAAYGRFSTQKGFDTLLQAMKSILKDQVRLKVGGYGPDEAMLKKLAQGSDNIEFCGVVQDVPAFLSTCDAVVIPSRWEPWGHVCLEAKAAGKPVIASDVDGLSEQVQNGGILVPPDDPKGLAAAIQKIIGLPQQTLEAWGKIGRNSVSRAWEKYLEEWEQLLLQVLDSTSLVVQKTRETFMEKEFLRNRLY